MSRRARLSHRFDKVGQASRLPGTELERRSATGLGAGMGTGFQFDLNPARLTAVVSRLQAGAPVDSASIDLIKLRTDFINSRSWPRLKYK